MQRERERERKRERESRKSMISGVDDEDVSTFTVKDLNEIRNYLGKDMKKTQCCTDSPK